MPGLRANYAWHARCLPASHAAHRLRAGMAHPHPMKQDWSSGCAWAMGGSPIAQAWPLPGQIFGREGKSWGKIWLEISQMSMAGKGKRTFSQKFCCEKRRGGWYTSWVFNFDGSYLKMTAL